MQFKTVKSATAFVSTLRVTRGYRNNATAEWRRLSMKLSDCALIQFARRLALRLEIEKGFLIGVDEQDLNPKVYVLDGNRSCILFLTKQVDEQTRQATYTLGYMGEPLPGHLINVSNPPTDEDLIYAFTLIESMSLEITRIEHGRRSAAE